MKKSAIAAFAVCVVAVSLAHAGEVPRDSQPWQSKCSVKKRFGTGRDGRLLIRFIKTCPRHLTISEYPPHA